MKLFILRSGRRVWDSPTLTTWGSVVLRTASSFITTPLIVTRMNTPEIAVWYLFSSTMALQPLFEMGFTPSFERAIAYAMGGATELSAGRRALGKALPGSPASEDLLDRLCVTMRWLYMCLAIVTTTVLAIGGTLALRRSIAQVASPGHAWVAWAIILAGSFVTFQNLSCSAYLQGTNRIPWLRRREIATTLAAVVACAAVLLAGGGMIALALVTQLCAVGAAAWTRYACRQARPAGFVTPLLRPDMSIVRAIWPATWRSGIGVMMSQGVVQLSALAYAQLGTPAQVAALLFSLRILQILLSMCQAPFYSKIPLLARLYAAGETKEQLRVARRGMALSYWVYVLGVVTVGVGMHRILLAIGSHITFIDTRLWYLIGLAYFVERFGAMHIQLYSLTNDIIWHRANGISGILYLAVLWFAFPYLGLYAFPAAVFAGYLGFYSWYSALHSYRWYKLRFWQFDARTSLMPAVVLLVFVVAAILGLS